MGEESKVGSSIALARQWPGNRMNFSQDRTLQNLFGLQGLFCGNFVFQQRTHKYSLLITVFGFFNPKYCIYT
jgi:hypothetical protein